jgi:hypothetical protein
LLLAIVDGIGTETDGNALIQQNWCNNIIVNKIGATTLLTDTKNIRVHIGLPVSVTSIRHFLRAKCQKLC